jgi:phage gp45-like
MTWSDVRDFVYQAIGWLVSYTRVAKSSAGGSDDEVEGRSEPNEPSYQIPVRRMWPFGIRSRPPAGVEAIVVLVNGGGTRAVMVSAESAKYGPSDLDDGESALYNKTAAVIRLWSDGHVSIDADNADVVVNQGSAKVHRVGDQGDGGTIAFTSPSTLAGTYTDPDGVPHPFSVGTPIVLKTKATEGAERFKG